MLLGLVRLQHDLVASSLSHFALVVRRLSEILRTVRPEPGAAQRQSVTDELPPWINPTQPLPPECAKALARLLTNLTAKTIARLGPGPSAHSCTIATATVCQTGNIPDHDIHSRVNLPVVGDDPAYTMFLG
jgi:hypothetical protein